LRPTEFTPIQLIFPDSHKCYQIPAFQRNFQWGPSQLHGLVRDIKRITFSNPVKPHWIGVALIAGAAEKCELQNKEAGHVCYDVLDGQQRLLTTRIWIIALLDEYFYSTRKELEKYDRKRLVNVKVHALDTDDWKIISNRDKAIALDPTESSKSAMLQAYLYFRQIILNGVDGLIREEELPLLKKPSKVEETWLEWLRAQLLKQNPPKTPLSATEIEKLIDESLTLIQMTTLTHEDSDEDVEVIFETLNAKRAQLGQWDLFRNYVLIKSQTHGKDQKDLYTKSLAKAEKAVNSAKIGLRQSNLDRFLYDFLISEGIGSSTGTLRADATSLEFRKYWESLPKTNDIKSYMSETLVPSMECWLAAISAAQKFKYKDREIKFDQKVWRTLRRIESMTRGPLVPITSKLIRDWAELNTRDQSSLIANLSLVETLIARMILSATPLSPLRSIVISGCQDLFANKKTKLATWVQANTPQDDRIRKILGQTLPSIQNGKPVESDPDDWIDSQEFYERASSKQIRAIFDAFVEKKEGPHGSILVGIPGKRETAKIAISVEHLFPQSPVNWLSDFGKWGVDPLHMQNRLHCLGNIAVLPADINPKLSNLNLKDKQKKLDLLSVPHWRIDKVFHDAKKWGPDEVDERTRSLIDLALSIWPTT
jgi:hypothetical protein